MRIIISLPALALEITLNFSLKMFSNTSPFFGIGVSWIDQYFTKISPVILSSPFTRYAGYSFCD
jgi:hypothetical protein